MHVYIKIYIKKMLGVRSIAMIYQLELLYTLPKKLRVHPLFIIFLLYILRKTVLNQNDVEFDCSIDHALVLFLFL